MSVTDLRCDRCDRLLLGPGDPQIGVPGPGGLEMAEPASPAETSASETALTPVRFVYHPGDYRLRDDSGLLCAQCWTTAVEHMGGETRKAGSCAVCRVVLERGQSLHVLRSGDPVAWELCRVHAVEFLNALHTVEPKLDAATFTFPSHSPPTAPESGAPDPTRSDEPESTQS